MLHDPENTPGSPLDWAETLLALTEPPAVLAVIEALTPRAARPDIRAFLPPPWRANEWKVTATDMTMPTLRGVAETRALAHPGDIANPGAEALSRFDDVLAWPWDAAVRLVFGAPEDARRLQAKHPRGVRPAWLSTSVPSPSGGDAPAPSGDASPRGSEGGPEPGTAWTATARLTVDQTSATLRPAASSDTSAVQATRGLRLAPTGGGQ